MDTIEPKLEPKEPMYMYVSKIKDLTDAWEFLLNCDYNLPIHKTKADVDYSIKSTGQQIDISRLSQISFNNLQWILLRPFKSKDTRTYRLDGQNKMITYEKFMTELAKYQN